MDLPSVGPTFCVLSALATAIACIAALVVSATASAIASLAFFVHLPLCVYALFLFMSAYVRLLLLITYSVSQHTEDNTG